MRVLVLVKHVPDTTEIHFDALGQLQTRSAPTKINDYDRNALEAAAQLREREGAEVIVACAGPSEAAKTLKEALAFGADRAVLVSGFWADGLDSEGAARVLAAVSRAEGPFDLILAGDVSEDGYDGLVPGLVAGALGAALVRGATDLEVSEDGFSVTRTVDRYEETYRVRGPVVVSVTRLLNTPRTITTMQVMKVPMSRVQTRGAADFGVDEDSLGEATRAVRVLGVRPATRARANEILSGGAPEVARALVARLEERGVLA